MAGFDDTPLRIGMVGSRGLTGWRFHQFRAVAEILTLAGMQIVSGGADGADEAAFQGAAQAYFTDPATLCQPRLHLNGQLGPWNPTAHQNAVRYVPNPRLARQRHNRYRGAIEILHDTADDLAELAAQHCFPEQRNSQWFGNFVRNASIAQEADVLLAWPIADSRGTQHTMRVALALGRRVLDFEAAYQAAPWASVDEIITRITPYLRYASRRDD